VTHDRHQLASKPSEQHHGVESTPVGYSTFFSADHSKQQVSLFLEDRILPEMAALLALPQLYSILYFTNVTAVVSRCQTMWYMLVTAFSALNF
tara:strand:+ start:8494 stop:8772 length:279 start_codon:yes stop_codon:yes gene_type:complete